MRNDVALLGFIACIALTSLYHQFSSSSSFYSPYRGGGEVTATWSDAQRKIESLQTDFATQLSKLTELVNSQSKQLAQSEGEEEGRNSLLKKLELARLELGSKPKRRIGEPRHVVFSTGRPNHMNGLEKVIAKNARLSMMSLPRTQVLYIDDNNAAIGKNPFGYPILKHMYLHAMSLVPDADTFTYFNHDLIFNASFVESADAVVYAARAGQIPSRFLMVGFRTNVAWTEDMVIGSNPEEMHSWDFEGVFKSGTRFQPDAQDYFTVSRDVWDWNSLPDFVIGRTAYDNWLVNKAVNDPNVAAIDGSATTPVIHQTGPAGNYQGHQGGDRANTEYNRILGQGQWQSGTMHHCKWETQWDSEGNVILRKR